MARDADSTDRVAGQRCRFPRLHWLAWLTLLASTIVVTLLVVPGFGVAPTLLKPQPFMWGATAWGGGPMPDPDQAVGPLHVEEFEHGWPFIFFRRAVGVGGKGWPKSLKDEPLIGWPEAANGAPWNRQLAWAFDGDASQWNGAALTADALIALALIVLPTCVCQWWIVRRGNRLRIHTVDLLAVGVVVAAALAWRQSHVQLQAVEERLLAALPVPAADRRSMWHDHRWGDRGPLWFDRLLGLGNYSCFRHLIEVNVIVDEMTEDDWSLLSQAAYVSDIRLYGHVSVDAAHALALLGQLRALDLYETRNLIDQFSPPAAELQRLSGLGALESIGLYRSDLLIEDMEAIAAIPILEEISVSGILATTDEQYAFRDAHPRLRVTCYEPSESKFESHGTDPWKVARARLLRWRHEDSVKVVEPADYEHNLDLRGIQLKSERILKLQPVLATVEELRFDASGEVSAVLALLRQSPNVATIRAAGLAANHELLECMAGMSQLIEVDVSQGAASVEDFLQLQRTKEEYWLNLYETTFTKEELSKLLGELNRRGDAEAYRGLDEATPAVEPEYEPGSPDDPFSAGF